MASDNEIKFNPDQEKAVAHDEGPLLIVAGAGTGKTAVLVERLRRLIAENKARADEILLITFTEKSAEEMENRTLKALPYGCVDLWIDTFHGFCERILRERALDIGLSPDFKIFSQAEQWMLIRKNLDAFNLDYYRPLSNPTKFIYELVKHFSRLKDENISPEEYLRYAGELEQNFDQMLGGGKKKSKRGKEAQEDETDGLEAARIGELANGYHVYNRLLLDNGGLDFGDIINETIRLFRERPNILKIYRDKFKYLMIDEFQDTNWAQYELIKILAGDKKNLVVVGDDDQAIYKFRGASLSNIMQFKDDYPEAKEIVLTKNYRSGQAILDAAYGFIRHNNPNRLEVKLKIDKKLLAENGAGGAIRRLDFDNERDEGAFVAGEILKIRAENPETSWADFAVLVRANDTADRFVRELTARNIPNLFVSLRGLYYKPVILDLVSYLKLLDDYHEPAAVFRTLNMEPFKILHSDLVNITVFARRKFWSFFEALKNIGAIPGVSMESAAAAGRLIAFVGKHSELVKREKISRLFVRIVNDLGILKKLDQHRDRDIYSYLNQFFQKIKEFETVEAESGLKDFLELLTMEKEAGETGQLKLDFEDEDVVKIMTVHAAKGLEFKNVFLVNLVDKKFPTIARKDKIAIPDALVREKLPEGKDIHLEEERRLFYVAITRARDRLYLTGARDCGGAREKRPSPFIAEAGVAAEERRKSETASGLAAAIEELHSPLAPAAGRRALTMPVKFSFSQLEAYDNCPLQYSFNFILNVPSLPKAAFVFGRVMHAAVRDFFLLPPQSGQKDLFGGQGETRRPNLDDLLAAYEKNWDDDGYNDRKDRDDHKKRGRKMLEVFYRKLEENGWPEIMFLEKNFLVRVGKYYFRGAIDRVDRLPDGSVELIDYKTGQAKNKLDYRNKRQLLLYKLAVERGLNFKVGRLSYYYFDSGEKQSFSPALSDEEKLETDLIAGAEKILEGKFPPNPGFLCEYCDFRQICEFKA